MKRIVQISCLGNFGRLGNQFFQYAFAKAYAQKYNAILEIPINWIGRKLFEINDPPISARLPRTNLDIVPWGQINIDLFGYFQFKNCYNLYSLKDVRTWFKFKNKWLTLLPKQGKYIACHLRAGDYVTKYSNIYCIVSDKSYVAALAKFGLDINEVIWVSEETKRNNVECDKLELPFLPDFMTLYNADILFRANSCFSLWAAILSGKEVYSPIVIGKRGKNDVEFVKGNEELIVDDYQGSSPQQPSKFIFKE